jgi:putative zinc finger/helix-turn-helix YgiT family protein
MNIGEQRHTAQRGAPKCPDCGEHAVSETQVEQPFPYGDGDNQVLLRAVVPVLTCNSCGEQFADARAEILRHEAVCRHLGRMTPRELRDLRDGYGLSQEQWADLTGLGAASVKRWETGANIQNEAYDRFMWLLLDSTIFDLLRQRYKASAAKCPEPEFRTKIRIEVRHQAETFQLLPPFGIANRRFG